MFVMTDPFFFLFFFCYANKTKVLNLLKQRPEHNNHLHNETRMLKIINDYLSRADVCFNPQNSSNYLHLTIIIQTQTNIFLNYFCTFWYF